MEEIIKKEYEQFSNNAIAEGYKPYLSITFQKEIVAFELALISEENRFYSDYIKVNNSTTQEDIKKAMHQFLVNSVF